MVEIRAFQLVTSQDFGVNVSVCIISQTIELILTKLRKSQLTFVVSLIQDGSCKQLNLNTKMTITQSPVHFKLKYNVAVVDLAPTNCTTYCMR